MILLEHILLLCIDNLPHTKKSQPNPTQIHLAKRNNDLTICCHATSPNLNRCCHTIRRHTIFTTSPTNRHLTYQGIETAIRTNVQSLGNNQNPLESTSANTTIAYNKAFLMRITKRSLPCKAEKALCV